MIFLWAKGKNHQVRLPGFVSTRVFFKALVLLAFGGHGLAWGQFVVTDLGVQSPTTLVQTLLGSGVTIIGTPSFTGTGGQGGIFSGGMPVVGIDSGIILSNGDAAGVVGNGSNYSSSVTASTCWSTVGDTNPGDQDLASLDGVLYPDLYDVAILSFNFTTAYNYISFQYVFASEEYNEYVGSPYNDVFGFFLSAPGMPETNLAVLPGGGNVSVNTVNNCMNAVYYIDNIGSPQGSTSCTVTTTAKGLDTTMNGLTKVLSASATLTMGVTYQMKIAIADVGDCRNDSNVFIQANSFVSYYTPTYTPTATPTPPPCGFPGNTCTPTWTATFYPTAPTSTPCGWPGNTCTPSPTPSFTPTLPPFFTFTPTSSWTPDLRPTITYTPSNTPTITPTPTQTFTPTITNTRTYTVSPTSTATATPTHSSTATLTPTATPTPTDTPCGWPGLTCTFTVTATPTATIPYEDIFYVDHNLFSPSQGPVSIYVDHSAYPGPYSLKVYNTAGEFIRDLSKDANNPTYLTSRLPPQSYHWYGTNYANNPCASGVYIFYLIEPFDQKAKKIVLVK